MAVPEPGTFGAELRRLRKERGIALRKIAPLALSSTTVIWELEHGRKDPAPKMAALLDEILDAHGVLTAAAARALTPADVDHERVAYAADHPRGVDSEAVKALHGVLAHMRRLEDTIGAGPLLVATAGTLQVVENLADEARGDIRPDVVDLAGQWAQFAGWLRAATDDPAGAREWYARTLEHATEAGNADLVATSLSMRGNLAWMARRPGPLVGLSEAAAAQPASPGIRAMALQQKARGHALMKDADAVDEDLDEATELMAEATEHPEDEPAWVYFYSPGYLDMQRGLANRLLGRHEDAIEQLTAGLEKTNGLRGSEFVSRYVLQLAEEHAAAGNRDVAAELLGEVRAVATTTGSAKLSAEVERVARKLRL